ncbi:MAG: hypothetical protein P8H59_12050 [Flavobacteriales bacterium]|nr:hypothetical protein [Flavobacteriales bacterium]MDG1781680.1 hypothetical protein [Flavobacteriales bacterium]MDG2244883.1 hypothetical protein [Flavobacteriales bacterium]
MFNEKLDELEDFRSETPQAFFRFADGILRISIKSEMIIDLRTIERIEHFRREMTVGWEIPVLIEVPNDRLLLDTEAFRYMFSEKGMEGCLAKAIVVNAPLRIFLRNFTALFQFATQTFRVFRSKSEAHLWLFEFLPKEEESSEQFSNFV